jgi:hypothetical protein
VKVYAKKLASQESGYSGNTPNQRGKYVLVTKANLAFFPFLSNTTLNDSRLINLISPNGRNIGVNIIYHNAKFFPQTHDRAHDEVRIYRNAILEADLSLDRGVIFVMVETEKPGTFSVFSVQPSDPLFSNWEIISADINQNGPKNLDQFPFSDSRLSISSVSLDEDMDNGSDIITDALRKKSAQRTQQPALVGDPGKILEFVINTQQKYAEWVRQIYNNRCAVRGVSLVKNNAVGLDACHIMGHAYGGPLLPTNGILMSKDIHACFDQGLMSLDHDNKIIVSSTIDASSELFKFADTKVKPIAEYEIFSPYSGYVEHHKNTLFIP